MGIKWEGDRGWVPAFAGTTERGARMTEVGTRRSDGIPPPSSRGEAIRGITEAGGRVGQSHGKAISILVRIVHASQNRRPAT